MVGKKKTKDVQFYREALDSLVDETSGRRVKLRYGDEDEIAQEQEERRRRAEANGEFKIFAERVVEASRNTLEVDVPFRDLGFSGVPGRQNVLLQPTTDCLVHLVEPPFLLVTLSEVEVAFLERVVFGLKNFDLVLILKDHSVTPVHISSIPMTQLEAVKEWLDSVDVYYVESKVNFNWTNIMKTVNEDPVGFYEMGGWTYLQPDEANGEDDEDEEAGSSEYEPEVEDEEEEEEEEGEERRRKKTRNPMKKKKSMKNPMKMRMKDLTHPMPLMMMTRAMLQIGTSWRSKHVGMMNVNLWVIASVLLRDPHLADQLLPLGVVKLS